MVRQVQWSQMGPDARAHALDKVRRFTRLIDARVPGRERPGVLKVVDEHGKERALFIHQVVAVQRLLLKEDRGEARVLLEEPGVFEAHQFFEQSAGELSTRIADFLSKHATATPAAKRALAKSSLSQYIRARGDIWYVYRCAHCCSALPFHHQSQYTHTQYSTHTHNLHIHRPKLTSPKMYYDNIGANVGSNVK